MAARSAVVVGAGLCGPACFLPSKLLKESPVHRNFMLPRSGVHFPPKVCRRHALCFVAVASSDVQTETEQSPSNVKKFKSREVWRKDPAAVTYLEDQPSRYAFVTELRFVQDLSTVFAKHGNLDLRELVHIIYRLQERNEGRVALKLVDYLEKTPFYAEQLDEAFYRAALTAAASLPYHAERAAELWQAAKERGLVQRVETFNVYLAELAKKGDLEAMEAVLREMEAEGLQRNTDTWNRIIQAYGKQKELDRAVAAFTELQATRLKPNADTYCCLIKAFSSSGRTEDGERMVRESGIAMTQPQYNAIMDGYAKEQRPEKVGEILKEAQIAGVEPNNETFTILLKTFSLVGDAKGAWETYRALRSAGFPPSNYAHQLLSTARRKDQRSQGVRVRHTLELLDSIAGTRIRVKEVMEKKAWGYKWRLNEVKAILRFLQKEKKADLAEKIVRWAYTRPEEDKLQPDEEMIATLIQAYGQAGKVEKAVQAYRKLGKGEAAHIAPTKRAFGALVQAYVASGDIAQAEQILEESEKKSGEWPQADTYSYYALMRHYASKGNAEKVQALFDRALAAEVAPNPATFLALLSAYDMAGQQDKALALYDSQGPSYLSHLSEGDSKKLTDFLQRHGRREAAKEVKEAQALKKQALGEDGQAASPDRGRKGKAARLPEGFEALDRTERAKALADILTGRLRREDRQLTLEAIVDQGFLSEQEDYLQLAIALTDKGLKQSGVRVVELLPFMRRAGLDFPPDAWTGLVKRSTRAMQAASMFFAAQAEAGPDWDDNEAAQALAKARKDAGKHRWANHVAWCITQQNKSLDETLDPRLWPDDFAVTDLKGCVGVLRNLGREEEALALETRINEAQPQEVLRNSENGLVIETSEDASEAVGAAAVANVPSDA